MWWHMSINPALVKQMQNDPGFEVNLGYIARLCFPQEKEAVGRSGKKRRKEQIKKEM